MDERDQCRSSVEFACLLVGDRFDSGQWDFKRHHVLNPIFLWPNFMAETW